MALIGHPDYLAQAFDNVFHLNAIRYIVDSGNASSLTLGSFQGGSGLGAIYPATWHAAAALIVEGAGCAPQVAENSLNLVTAAIVWPLSCVFLVLTLFRRGPVSVFAAAVLSVSQVAFPYLILVWGPLFPNVLSISLLPTLLAIIVEVCRGSRLPNQQTMLWGLAFLIAFAGSFTAHMSVMNTLLCFVVPLVVATWFARFREAQGSGWYLLGPRFLRFVAFIVAFGTFVVLAWWNVRPAPYTFWGPTASTSAAIGDVVSNGPMNTGVALLTSVLCISGVVATFVRREHRWLVVAYVVVAVLYIVDASFPRGALRDIATGTWYSDTYRLAALIPIAATPLAAYGADVLARRAMARLNAGRLVRGLPRRVVALISVAGMCAIAAGVYLGPVGAYVGGSKGVYSLSATSPVLSTDELALIERLPHTVPEGVKIADNPWNGSSLAYAFAGIKVLTPHLFDAPTEAAVLIDQRFKFESGTSEMCSALRSENVGYILDFGHYYLANNASTAAFPGVTDVSGTSGLTLVDSEGPDAKLYRIDSCGRG